MTISITKTGNKRGRKPKSKDPASAVPPEPPEKRQKRSVVIEDEGFVVVESCGSKDVSAAVPSQAPKKRQRKLIIQDEEDEDFAAVALPEPAKNVKDQDEAGVTQDLQSTAKKGKAPVPRTRKKTTSGGDSDAENQKKRKGKSIMKEAEPPKVRKPRNNKSAGPLKINDVNEDEEEAKDLEMDCSEDEYDEETPREEEAVALEQGPAKKKVNKKGKGNSDCQLTGEVVPREEAERRWPHRYGLIEANEGGDEFLLASMHYTSAQVDGVEFNLNDCCLVKAAEGELDYIGRIVEFFKTVMGEAYISVKWFFRAADTVIKQHSSLIEAERIFASESVDDNPLSCIVKKVSVVQASSAVDGCDFFCNRLYSEKFCSFENLPKAKDENVASSSSTVSSEDSSKAFKEPMTLLDMYAGCGGMSTGLSIGTAAANVKLVPMWAVDYCKEACQSLRHNHPGTEVINGKAEDFLELLKIWKKLCQSFGLLNTPFTKIKVPTEVCHQPESKEDAEMCPPDDNGEYEVERIIDICYGDPRETGKASSLYYLVKWKGYGSDWNTWEPASGLEKCDDCIREFVKEGYKSHKLPLPGTVDVICGGPPCQGVSGFNRFRAENPLEDDKNFQLVVFMRIIEFLQPKFSLMENVVDLMRYKDAFLGRYAIARLVAADYQVRLGLLVAGSFGLPQYRMRAFLWGARTTEILPQFPLPTHKVIGRGHPPVQFVNNLHTRDQNDLLGALVLEDALTDLPPPISTLDKDDVMNYVDGPQTDFQWRIRQQKHQFMVSAHPRKTESLVPELYDHQSLKLSEDDNVRVGKIPKLKGANYRDLPGVLVDENNKAKRDMNNIVLIEKSGKKLVPEYALKFVKGTSKKPFGRLWWDEIVSTVVTRAEPHNQAVLHPAQDRVLSVRENARLQGFPDYYKLFGTIKQKYMQVGNAVAVPVGRALGYALGNAVHGISNGGQVFTLPASFTN